MEHPSQSQLKRKETAFYGQVRAFGSGAFDSSGNVSYHFGVPSPNLPLSSFLLVNFLLPKLCLHLEKSGVVKGNLFIPRAGIFGRFFRKIRAGLRQIGWSFFGTGGWEPTPPPPEMLVQTLG